MTTPNINNFKKIERKKYLKKKNYIKTKKKNETI